MSEPLAPDYEAKMREHVATMSNYSLGNLFARDLLAEVDRLRAELSTYEALNPQQCPKGIHADWLVDSEYTHACPWCRLVELERPTVEARRNEIRSSYTELISQAEQGRDFEGAATLTLQLSESEAKWAGDDPQTGGA
jgi:hypothetical protein